MRNGVGDNPLVKLLHCAIDRQVIESWSIDGPRLILYKNGESLAVPLDDAEEVLRRMLLRQQARASSTIK